MCGFCIFLSKRGRNLVGGCLLSCMFPDPSQILDKIGSFEPHISHFINPRSVKNLKGLKSLLLFLDQFRKYGNTARKDILGK